LVSAGWFSDLFQGVPKPSDEGDVLFSPSNFGLDDLADGVQLKRGWNYWYTWSDEDLSIKDATADLEGLRYILTYDSNWKHQGYWYPNKDENRYDEFKSGYRYALYMNQKNEWKYDNKEVFTFDSESCDGFVVSYDGTKSYFTADSIMESSGKSIVDVSAYRNGSWLRIGDNLRISETIFEGDIEFTVESINVDTRVVEFFSSLESIEFEDMCLDSNELPETEYPKCCCGTEEGDFSYISSYDKESECSSSGDDVVSGIITRPSDCANICEGYESESSKVTYQGVLEMLDRKCGVVIDAGADSCHQVCVDNGVSCLMGQTLIGFNDSTSLSLLIGCTDDPINEIVRNSEVDKDPAAVTDIDMVCICCESS